MSSQAPKLDQARLADQVRQAVTQACSGPLRGLVEAELSGALGPGWLSEVNRERNKHRRPGLKGTHDRRGLLSLAGYQETLQPILGEQAQNAARQLLGLANAAAHDEPLAALDGQRASERAEQLKEATLAAARSQWIIWTRTTAYKQGQPEEGRVIIRAGRRWPSLREALETQLADWACERALLACRQLQGEGALLARLWLDETHLLEIGVSPGELFGAQLDFQQLELGRIEGLPELHPSDQGAERLER